MVIYRVKTTFFVQNFKILVCLKIELLNIFTDKGVALQKKCLEDPVDSTKDVKTEDLGINSCS